ncbi:MULTISPECIES: HAD family phosphatase [unclassified Chelatococcus]|uniref:HAD family hydrolase n=1 Tax=unclassified Chelatococcus TaxID=2638111 RepID=UPI001BCD4F8A|nr:MULTISPECIES: HAD family phosphatase [unclassified Chelatococcus]MBS7695787.1 HAD family phosphatase [Chelatococcus sp. YT9]MBX3555838.1 HAD family phosphatase [Chelatococcus sp.]
MSQLKLAIFDMDDVLCTYDRAARIDTLAALSGRSPDYILSAIWDSGFEARSDAGDLDAARYLAGFGERLGYPLTRTEWVDARRLAMHPRPEVLLMVEAVKTRVPVALLTNNGFLVAEEIATLFPALPALFGERLFVSAMFGLKKPDPEIYRAVARRVGVAPHEAFFTDDKPRNVRGAEMAGLTGHVFVSPEGLASALARHGLIDSALPPP